MTRWVFALLFAGLAGAGFGWYGLFTKSGNRSFDEMDGIIPAVSGLLGMVMLGAAFILGVVALMRGRAT